VAVTAASDTLAGLHARRMALWEELAEVEAAIRGMEQDASGISTNGIEITPEEIAALLRPGVPPSVAKPSSAATRRVRKPRASSKRQRVLDAWLRGVRTTEGLCAASGADARTVGSCLGSLRAEGRISGKVERKRRVAAPAPGKSGPFRRPLEPPEHLTTVVTTSTRAIPGPSPC
jgi:hypothetical protein